MNKNYDTDYINYRKTDFKIGRMLIFSVLSIVLFACRTVDCVCPLVSSGIYRFGPDCHFMCHCKNNEQCDDTTGECSSGCASFWYGPGCQYRDVAEGEFSRHSDNLDFPHQQYSNLSNDGNSETCSYTAEVNSKEKKTNPFWRVWLPTTERISELMILTKVEKLNHFEGFEVYVENVTADERKNNEFQPKDSQKCYRHTGDAPRNESIKVLCENPVVGNQVRIKLKTLRSQLVLCDVKINGGRNLAFDRNISQTKPIRDSKPASNAVNGLDRQSTWTECSYTTSVDKPFLKLDIGRNALIWYIRILPYKDVHTQTYENLSLQLADDKTILIEKTVNIFPQTQSANITLNTAVARYVTITKTGESERLQICELKVFGECLEDECGFDCSKTCHCKYTNIWDKMDGKCSSGCKHGWKGKSCDQPSGTEYQQSCGHCLDPDECNTSTGECRTGCQDGYYPPDCKKECPNGKYGQNCASRCPSNCNDSVCDSVDGKCQLGCKPGFVGEKCEQKCNEMMYGQNCLYTCPPNCKHDACDNVDGKCMFSCKTGYIGEKCEQKCHSGRYGQNCGDKCPSSCYDGECDNVDGKCQSGCKPGYFGEKCEYKCHKGEYGHNCTLKCSDNCENDGNCNNVNGTCVDGCKPGYYGRKCEQECRTGRYGQNCRDTCPSNCNDGVCDRFDGKCQSGCKPGYIGEKCENNCDKGKYGQNCTSKCSDNCQYDYGCNNVDGTCVYGCKPGFLGKKCDQECPLGKYGHQCRFTCSSSCNDGLCDSVDGKCQSGCKPGYVGETCEYNCGKGHYGQNCSLKCSDNCKYDGRCNNVDGTCEHGCKPGYSDKKCKQKCQSGRYGENCGDTCSSSCNDGLCNSVDGKCQSGCKPGYSGDKCENKCSYGKYGQNCTLKCSDNCKYDGRCNNVDGTCVYGCKPGYSSKTCEQECQSGRYGENCRVTCSSGCNDDVCDSNDGKCQSGCKPGYFGEKCENECHNGKYGQNCTERCSDNCFNGTCNTVDGSCAHGCKPGYLEGKCEQECPNGKYGQNCDYTCSKSCTNGLCDNVDGKCIYGCKPGYVGATCEQNCDEGFYGTNCSMECGYCENTTSCDKVSGICMEGCAIGYQGDNCLQAMVESRPTSAASIIGVSVAVCILLIVAVVVSVVIIVKRRKHSQRTEENRNSLKNDEIHNTAERSDATSYQGADDAIGQTAGQLSIYANAVPTEANQISKSAISISALVEHVKGNSGKILEEFKALPVGMIHPSTVGMKPYNRGKNRYKDMRAYDHSRVILTKRRGEHGSDYINASFIKGYSKEQAYIAAQGPIENTIDDFWRMIWEQNVYTIVMLTNLVEEQKKKCLQYWPSEEPTIKYGNYIVCMVSEAIYAEFIVRNLTVSSEGKPPRNICQFHFKAWPDKGLPRSPSSLLQFWRKVRRMSKQRPWLVHCSAGVGRTGTFIATDILFDQVRAEGYVDVFAYVKDLRDQRTNMVQTKDQYKLLFVLMIECFILPSEPVSLDNIHRIMNDLNTVESTSRKTKLKLQYKALNEDMSYLSTFDESEDRYSAARLADNKNKNRFSDIIPQNEFRPFLITNIPSCTNYVNAVFMPSYCEINSVILTQIPLENTAIDCCRLVYEQEVRVIVTFEEAVKGNVGMYLPERDSITLGPFIVVKTSEEDSEFYKKRTYTMSYKSEEKAITELAFKAWPKGLVVPKDPGAMLNFIQEVENHKRATGNKPVIVQCLNGAEKSGLIAVLVNIFERARLEEEVSIPQVIRQLRVRREQIVPNFEQFQFCYDMLLHYVERDTTYANM